MIWRNHMIGKSKTIIETTVDRNLCVSCGICISVCPKKCIAFHKRNGQYIPQIEVSRCTKCGVCSEICSAHNMEFKKYATINKQKFTKDWMNGNYISCYNGYSLNNKIRFNSASGGLITTIVQKLLNDCTYDKAFLVEDFNYNKIVESMPFTKGNELINTSKLL
jgi:coenzyme F420 hydrogenase subunit beta